MSEATMIKRPEASTNAMFAERLDSVPQSLSRQDFLQFYLAQTSHTAFMVSMR
jgi:hypothetical protein